MCIPVWLGVPNSAVIHNMRQTIARVRVCVGPRLLRAYSHV